MKRHLLSTLTLSMIAAFGTPVALAADSATTVSATAAAGLSSGIDTQHMDRSVRPQDDFYSFVNGTWMKNTDIPGDKSSWGAFMQLRDESTQRLHAIVEELQKDPAAKQKGSEAQKIADLYASYMNQAHRDALGIKPLTGELSRIRGLKDKKGVPGLIAHLAKIGVSSPYGMYIGQDARKSTEYIPQIGQSGLGLPDREYYLKLDDAKLADMRAKYLQHIEKTLTLAGIDKAAEKAKAIVAFETELAKVQWGKVENRDPIKRYNKMTKAELAKLTPGYDWNAALAAAGIAGKAEHIIVSQPSYLQGFAKVLEQTDLATVKNYFEWKVLSAYSPYLSKPFVDENFGFYGTVLTGVTEQAPEWKTAIAVVEGSLGEALGKQYVAKHFPAERKARMEVLVKNLITAYGQSIDNLEWMSPTTKKEARAKLASFTPKIGYPDVWRDYSALSISRDDLVGNRMRTAQFNYNRNINKLGKPIDRTEWGMTPQTVNAYYRSTTNEIVFPAAILQPPFFDMNADDAVNYGAIGAVIGHEIGHGFDDKGSQSDGDGNLRDWWTPEDKAAFKARTDKLVNQYNGFSPLPGYHVNGELTLGENIGDNAGLSIGYKAYMLSLGGKPAPVIDGFTGAQRFFIGFGQVWRTKMRDAAMINQVKTNPHSPGEYRANGTVQNMPEFYEAFDVKPGDKMYLPPEQRVVVW